MKILTIFCTLGIINESLIVEAEIFSREVAALQRNGWQESSSSFDAETKSLVDLLIHVSETYFLDCVTVIIYDVFFEENEPMLLRQLIQRFPTTFVLRRGSSKAEDSSEKCHNYIALLENLHQVDNFVERRNIGKVVIVSGAKSWSAYEFLKSHVARLYYNLLVISQCVGTSAREGSYLLYTHKLYSDGIGSSRPFLLTSWVKDSLTRPEITLFPEKLGDGFNGHRFSISAAHMPPFVIRKAVSASDDIRWDGIDVRLMKLLQETLNFTTDIRSPASSSLSPIEAAKRDVADDKASIAMGGIYRTVDLMSRFDTSFSHMEDCASFISLTSTALPRYRAVLGPFRLSVWINLTFAYLVAIIPLTLNSGHSLFSLITHPKKLNDMFWFVFSTFTNCFTVKSPLLTHGLGKNSTGILMGLYWVFTIIITSCYTSSIIAFITVPVYPTAMETSQQLLYYRYRIGTLDHDGWESWFDEGEDLVSNKLLKNMELLPSIEDGLRNASRAYFWPYAFLGSRTLLEYIVQANFTPSWATKRSAMHISRECFVPFGVTFAFPRGALHTDVFSKMIQRGYQNGLVQKIISDVQWDVQRSSSGKLLQANSGTSLQIRSTEERQLTLDDVQGTFMVLGSGILIGMLVLLIECISNRVGRCCKKPIDNINGMSELELCGKESDLPYGNTLDALEQNGEGETGPN